VSGLAAGEGKLSNSNEFMGVAPKAHPISLKVLDANGAGRTSDVIRAIEFAIRNRAALRIHILNLSLGHPIYEPAAEDPLVQAVESATRAGLIVVVAAGNYGRSLTTLEPGYAGIASPGNAPSAITVGAVNTNGTVRRDDDRVARYSSRGPTWYDGVAKPDLVAPGHGLGATASVDSTLYAMYPQLLISAQKGTYLRLSGTSMAAAVTSGVIAHMLEANWNTNGSDAPSLTPNAVKAVLQYTAVPEHILNKPGKLTPEEFEEIKKHAVVGAEILADAAFPYPVVPIVRHHHEAWDGSGYPDGIKGEEIPLGARILAVVDCFDALTSDRPYRPRMPVDVALQILRDRRGRMYEPRIVDEFIELVAMSAIDLPAPTTFV
jgi:subtilisin family serine protease